MIGLDKSNVVATAAERAVVRSFQTRPLPIRGITRTEARRRVKICERIWQVLRHEKKWSLQRACDHLYRYLIDELDGRTWNPDERTIWVPDNLH